MKTRIFQVETDEHQHQVRELFLEYLEYASRMEDLEFGKNFDVEPIVKQDMNEIEMFFPPAGSDLKKFYWTPHLTRKWRKYYIVPWDSSIQPPMRRVKLQWHLFRNGYSWNAGSNRG